VKGKVDPVLKNQRQNSVQSIKHHAGDKGPKATLVGEHPEQYKRAQNQRGQRERDGRDAHLNREGVEQLGDAQPITNRQSLPLSAEIVFTADNPAIQ